MSSESRPNPLYPRFSLAEYKQNPAAIKKVNDAALEYLETLRVVIDKNNEILRKKDNKITELHYIGIIDMLQPLFIFLGSILLGFGINLATSYPHELPGWILSIAGSLVQLMIISVSLYVKLRK